MHALDPFAKVTQADQLAGERSQRIVQVAQRSTEPMGVVEIGCGLGVRVRDRDRTGGRHRTLIEIVTREPS
jgi:hypothetical protein